MMLAVENLPLIKGLWRTILNAFKRLRSVKDQFMSYVNSALDDLFGKSDGVEKEHEIETQDVVQLDAKGDDNKWNNCTAAEYNSQIDDMKNTIKDLENRILSMKNLSVMEFLDTNDNCNDMTVTKDVNRNDILTDICDSTLVSDMPDASDEYVMKKDVLKEMQRLIQDSINLIDRSLSSESCDYEEVRI